MNEEAIDINAVLDVAISSEQRTRLDGHPEPLRTRLYERIRDSLLASVRMQVEYCSKVGINSVALERLIRAEAEQWEHECQQQARVNAVLQSGASFAMASALLGMGKRDFDSTRKSLGLTGTVSRKPISDDDSARIYRQWQALGKPQDIAGFMELHQLSQQPLHLLWGLVQDWVHVQPRASKPPTRRRW